MRHDISAVEGELLNNKLFLVCSLSSMKKKNLKEIQLKILFSSKELTKKKKKSYTFSTDLFSYEKKN